MWSISVEIDYFDRSFPGTEVNEDEVLERKIVSKPKPKLKPPTTLERIFGKPGAVKDRYFSDGSNINEENQRNIHTEASPFRYPQDVEEFSYKVMSKAWRDIRRRNETQLKYNERQSYQTKQKTDLLNRLWVKDAEIKNMKTVLDLDPEFFTIVEGRPVPEKLSHKEYIQDVRDVLKTKIMTGYREDEILLIEEQFILEQREIEAIKIEFQKYVNTFEEFLFTDHTNSMALLRQSEEEALIASEKHDILRELSKNYGSLKSTVYNLEERWRNCKMYQKFLYLISPMDWRKKYDFYHIKRRSSEKSVELEEIDSASSVFGRFKLGVVGEVLSLENLIDQFLEDIRMQNEPELYFNEPSQLLKVFSFIELQNLNSLLHSEELAIPLENVREGMENTRIKFKADMGALQDIIDSLEGGIVWEEERAKYLEELAQELIHGDFKELISNDEVINMYVFVEDVYETRIAPNDSNLSMSEMMTIIEMHYRDFLLQLDRLPSDLVYRAEMECYADEARTMAVAKDAARKVIQVERLMKHLSRLLEPPVRRIHRDMKWRSAPMDKKKRPPPPPEPLTEEEITYLTYFVDYCDHTDDPKDFGIRVHKVEKKKKKEDGEEEDDEDESDEEEVAAP